VKGGPVFDADTVGPKEICARIDNIANAQDPRYWQVSSLLRRPAAGGVPCPTITTSSRAARPESR
jgi:hypothetical protein